MITAMLKLAAEGKLRPTVHQTMPLTEAVAALEVISSRGVIGKMILEIA